MIFNTTKEYWNRLRGGDTITAFSTAFLYQPYYPLMILDTSLKSAMPYDYYKVYRKCLGQKFIYKELNRDI